jgi:hypothetical protein
MAQETTPETIQATSNSTVTVIPQQVRFTATLPNRTGDTVEAVFRIYSKAEGGEPLWTETQKISVAQDGTYSVLLGAVSANGLPQTIFGNGAARWLGVAVERGEEEARIPLASTPYAMKAGDAQTLGGLPAASFVTQAQLAATSQALAGQAAQQISPMAAPTGTGTTNYLPLWTSSTNLANSVLYQSNGRIGLGVTTPLAVLHVLGGAVTPGLILQTGAGNGAMQIGADAGLNTLTPSVRKVARITMPDWAADANKVMFFSGDVTGANANDLYIGGSPGSADYAATGLHFVTAASGTTAGGTEQMTLTSTGNLGLGTKTPSTKFEVNGAAKFDGNITFATTQTFPGATGTQGPPGPAGVSFWTSTTLLQPFTDNVAQYGTVMGSSNATLDSDYYGKYRLSLIFPTACTASNFAVNLGYESLTFPFLLTTNLVVNGKVTPLSCSSGFATGYGFSCTASGTYAIPAGDQVILQFTHTGTDPSNVFPQVTFKCN